METKFRNLIFVIVMFFISGCSYTLQKYSPRLLESEHIYKKNYEFNSYLTASVGDPIIQVRDYFLNKYGKNIMVPEQDIKSGSFIFKKGTPYEIVYQTMVNNQIKYLLMNPNYGVQRIFVVLEDGIMNGENMVMNLYGTYVNMPFNLTVNPPNAKLSFEKDVKVDTIKGYKNFELIYSGTDKESFHLTYREYSPDEIARVAFFQNLTYPKDAAVIRFQGIKIGIKSVTAESITYTVLEDNLNK